MILSRLERLDVKVHASVGLVRVLLVDDHLNIQDNLIDVLGHARQHVRPSHAEQSHILHKLLLELMRERQISLLNRPISRAAVIARHCMSQTRLDHPRERLRRRRQRPERFPALG